MTGKARIDEVVRLIDEALAAFDPDLSQPDAGYEHGAPSFLEQPAPL